MGKLAQFNQQQKQLESQAVMVEKTETPKETPQFIVMSPRSEYPVTIDWPDGAITYQGEIDLLEACLQRAPDLAWYCYFLNLAKPYILERSRKRRGIK